MKNEEILERAIEKATANGWRNRWGWDEIYVHGDRTLEGMPTISPDEWPESPDEASFEEIIFTYKFAKALGYKLEELGKWCDKKKEPLKFIMRFCNKGKND